ncbi:MAG: hypothetical protein ACI8UR_001838 [Natronomonas sp.]|jgi:hypothetical protein
MMVVGFTAAPVAAADDGVSIEDDGISIGVGGDDGISVGAGSDDGVSVDAGGDDGVSVGAGDDGVSVDAGGDDDVSVDAPGVSVDAGTDTGAVENDSETPVNYSDIPLEELPVDLCRDVLGDVQETVPLGQLPGLGDLPSALQPPGVPTDLLTPEAVVGIVFGAVPNQCEVQDPYDPSVDPTDPPRDPGVDVTVARAGQYRDGAVALVYYDVTLNESGEGPGVSGKIGTLATSSAGDVDLTLTVNDGEKDYTVDPRVRYWDDGTAYIETNIGLLGSRLGVVVECNGQECQPGTRGLPQLVELPAIPAPTSQDDSGSDNGQTFPSELCTDVGELVMNNVPLGQVPWFDALPSSLQPPGVPTDLITPESVAAIAFGAVPNQCEVQDPNDPSVDPTDPPRDPGVDVTVARAGQYRDGAVALVYYDVTLNESGEGPGVSGKIGTLATSSAGDVDLTLTVNDGEKDYTVDPRVRYWDDGTAYIETNIGLLGSRLGIVVECNGQECQPGTRGLPQLVELPAIPAPTG